MTPKSRYPKQGQAQEPNEAHQHDLHEQAAAAVIALAMLSKGNRVLEIGPGLGALTSGLLKTGASVTAIERDPVRVQHLQKRFSKEIHHQQLTLIEGDVAHVKVDLGDEWQVVANPPFSLTATLVRKWLLAEEPPLAMTVVLQKEAADKLTGDALRHTRSSIISHLVGKPCVSKILPRNATTPPSRVDLAVWSHERHDEIPSQALIEATDRLLAIAFAGPRTLQEALRGVATTTQIRRQAAQHGWHPNDHPRTVSPAGWLDFAKLLLHCGKLAATHQADRRKK